jgi:hypothetical protein
MNTKSMLLAGGLAGAVMGLAGALVGLLSSFPLINCFGSCCCLWVMVSGCGILSVLIYRMSEKTQPGLTIGQGVLLGLIAGVVGAVIGSILGVLVNLVVGGVDTMAFMSSMDQIPGMSDSLDEPTRQIIRQFGSTSSNILISTVCNFVFYPVFGMAGGLIGAGLIWKK